MKLSDILNIENKYKDINREYYFYLNNDKDKISFILEDEETSFALSVLEFLLNNFNLKEMGQRNLKEVNLLNALGSADIENAGLSVDQLGMIRKGFVFTKGQRMVKNIYKVYNKPFFDLTEENILNAWKKIVRNCCENRSIKGNKYRSGDVIVGSFRPINYKYLNFVYPLFIEQVKKEDNIILRSLLLHFGTAFYHPFCDGNGRISRTLMRNELISVNKGIEYLPYDYYLFLMRYSYYSMITAVEMTKRLRFFTYTLLAIINSVFVNLLVKEREIEIDDKYAEVIQKINNIEVLTKYSLEYKLKGYENEIQELCDMFYLCRIEDKVNRIEGV